MEKWNPLELVTMNSNDDYKQLAVNSTKQQIRNILKSYVGYYDPLCELLQNAMDAVDRRKEVLHEENYEKRIKIIMNLQENSVYVADNGIGFEEKQFRTFLSPNITFKRQGHSRGNKGVGTTYIAYGFNRTEIYTKTAQYEKYAYIGGGREWIDDFSDTVEMPCVVTLESRDEKFVYDRGSSFKLYFTNEVGNKIKDFTWLGIDTAESWKYVLLTNTPLGYIKGFDETHDIFFDLVIVKKNGDNSILENFGLSNTKNKREKHRAHNRCITDTSRLYALCFSLLTPEGVHAIKPQSISGGSGRGDRAFNRYPPQICSIS